MAESRRLFIIACEPSADLHGALLLRELKKIEPSLEVRGLGGPKMAAEGATLLHDMTKISALGLGDVLRKYFVFRKIFYEALADVKKFDPQAIVAIDSPAFNLRFAKKIKKQIPFIYYIAPQIWAWGGRRIHTIKKTVSKMLVILPFEKELYDKAGVENEFVGHPLMDHVRFDYNQVQIRLERGLRPDDLVIGLLPGSREKEVERILPAMIESARLFKKMRPDAKIFLAEAPNVTKNRYDKILNRFPDFKIERRENYSQELVASLNFALIASGTATLEAALIGTPFFLMYNSSWTTYTLGKYLIRVPFLGLVNLLAKKRVVPEFIQNDLHPQTIAHEMKVLIENQSLVSEIKEEFRRIRKMLGEDGASAKTAKEVRAFLRR